MCVTYCHRRGVLYWNHEDCTSLTCHLAEGPHGRCEDCRHRQEALCRLTNGPLPDSGGCCHCNVDLVQGRQVVTPAMLELPGVGEEENMVDVLNSLEAPYRVDETGRVVVDPDELGLPFTYGRGTESQDDLPEPVPPLPWDWDWGGDSWVTDG